MNKRFQHGNQKGFTLMELVVFIVVTGIILGALVVPFNTALEKSPASNYQQTAVAYAQERMELILGQDFMLGYSSFSDPCTGGSAGSIPACTNIQTGYTVASTITTTTLSGTAVKQIIVTVTTPSNATFSLMTYVSN